LIDNTELIRYLRRKSEVDISKGLVKISEKEFNELSIPDQVDLFLHSSDLERLELLEIADAPREMLAKVPATEVWFTIKRLTPKDSLLLVKLASPEQLQVVSDIEWWKKDRLDESSIYEWLEYISACGMEKMVEWFQSADYEQVKWFFKSSIVVYKREDKEEDPYNAIQWPREEMPVTHEGIYYFQVLDEKHDQLIRMYLEILVKHNIDLYKNICEVCLWEMPSLTEEEAYEIKSRRLSEHGFPTFDESINIYSPLVKEKIKMAEKRAESSKPELTPRYPLTVLGDKVLFLNRVFGEFDEAMQDLFLAEISSIANKILVADGQDISHEELKDSIRKALGYINIGLEVLSEGDIATAVDYVNEYWLQTLFQVGLSEVLKISNLFKKVFKDSWMNGNEELLNYLEPDQKIFLDKFFIKRPSFSEISELQRAEKQIKESEFVGRMITNLFIDDLEGFEVSNEFVDNLRFTGIYLTVFVNYLISSKKHFIIIDSEDLNKVLTPFDFDKKMDEMNSWIIKRIKPTKDEEKHLNLFFDKAKERFIDEFKGIKDIDPRYIHSVWVK